MEYCKETMTVQEGAQGYQRPNYCIGLEGTHHPREEKTGPPGKQAHVGMH